ncbi:hypothetical protein AHF37_08552 [Paragonimus kellicotti]|nr:hypothetical protein AHF37_08552 [Paragonimus kellicotti]
MGLTFIVFLTADLLSLVITQFCPYRLLSFHPDQSYFFSSALGDYNVLVWNAETGAKMGTLEGHQSTVTGISFNGSGSSIATCGRDKVIIIWSCPEFERINLIPAFEVSFEELHTFVSAY